MSSSAGRRPTGVILAVAGRRAASGAWLVVPVVAIAFLQFALVSATLRAAGAEGFSLGDALVWFSSGIEPPTNTITVPYMWVAFYAFVLFSAGRVACTRPSAYSSAALFGLGSRARYWAATALAVVGIVIVQFVAVLAVLALCTVLSGGSLDLAPESPAAAVLLSEDQDMPAVKVLGLAFALPLFASCALALAEAALALLVGQLASFAVVFAYVAAAVFERTPLLLGNYLMIVRVEGVSDSGVPLAVGVVALALLGLVSLAVGAVKMRTWDYLFQKEDGR